MGNVPSFQPDVGPRFLYVVDVEYADGSKATHPARYLTGREDLAEMEAQYLDLSRRNLMFPNATAFHLRPAGEEEVRRFSRRTRDERSV